MLSFTSIASWTRNVCSGCWFGSVHESTYTLQCVSALLHSISHTDEHKRSRRTVEKVGKLNVLVGASECVQTSARARQAREALQSIDPPCAVRVRTKCDASRVSQHSRDREQVAETYAKLLKHCFLGAQTHRRCFAVHLLDRRHLELPVRRAVLFT